MRDLTDDEMRWIELRTPMHAQIRREQRATRWKLVAAFFGSGAAWWLCGYFVGGL